MKPFIAKYVQGHSLNMECLKEGLSSVQYCAELESSILSTDLSLAIDNKDVSFKATGTILTEARADPTLDESTDR
jgi:hypothetical protein